MRTLKSWVALSTFVLNAGSVYAQVIPGRWEKVASLTTGTAVVIRLRAGDRWEATFQGVDGDTLRLAAGGRDLTLPKSEVLLIETAAAKDRLLNGALIGAAAGTAAAMTAMYRFEASTNGPGSRWSPWEEENAALMLAAGAFGAGLGAIFGALVDSRVKAREVLYRAP